jgi:hypothetical protein
MKMTSKILLIICIIGIISCKPDDDFEKVNYEIGWFPVSPKNIEELNTQYDDYNSNINITGVSVDLYYSTNKDSKGDNFDISSRRIDAVVNLDNDVFNFYVSNAEPNYAYELLPLINTSFNEYGPFSFYSDSLVNSFTMWYFFYANNESGNFDIQFAYTDCGDWGHYQSSRKIYGPYKASVLNSINDDYYPTINDDYSKIYFSSNRDEKYDIYEIDLDFDNIVDWLKNGTNEAKKDSILSSSSDDKCAYIKGNLMVFASNRDLGYGGYDLWYSIFIDERWTAPTNFGPEINTEFDEYRPAVAYCRDSNNDLMIFSSNRPEGKGGFDLYYTGINKMIKK